MDRWGGDSVKLEALDHPKTLDFAARLGVELPTAIGHLELLWAFTGKKAPQGNIGKWADGAIARACYWMGDPKVFVQALIDAGFAEESAEHGILIHDWPEHAPRWVKAKLKSLGLGFLRPPESGSTDTTGDTTVDTTGDTASPPTKGREGKGSEEKGETRARRTSRVPKNFEPDRDLALRELPNLDVDREIQKFRDWEFATPRSDWPAVWRNWIQRCKETGQYAGARKKPVKDPYANAL